MTIWFVTIGEPVPTGPRFGERLHRTGMMATAFAAAGHDVVWWTSGFDHFKKQHIVQGEEEVRLAPNLRIRILPAPGYRSNVSIARLYDHDQLRRLFTKWARKAARPSAIVSSLPTVGLCKASISLGHTWGIPVVVDLRDMWPDIFTEVVPRLLRPGLRLALEPLFRNCKSVCERATALIGITEEFLAWGLHRAGRERREHDAVVPFVYHDNKFSAEHLSDAETFWDGLGIQSANGHQTVSFVGTLGRQFHLDAVIRCACRMTARQPGLRFVLCGSGDRLGFYQQMANGNPGIVFPGWIDSAKISVLLRRTSVGLDPMLNRADFLASVNNKAVEYLASGVPILSTPENGALARLLRETGSGESTKEGDDRSLEAALSRMLRDPERLCRMEQNAARLYADQFNPTTVYKLLIKHVEDMVQKHSDPI
jgi:glycosyltransferase involved in cell wall biosynthesis